MAKLNMVKALNLALHLLQERQVEGLHHVQLRHGRLWPRIGGLSPWAEPAGAGGAGKSETADENEREYRDSKGEVHHHTKTYMEQHKNEK